jgi:hypothetical protein
MAAAHSGEASARTVVGSVIPAVTLMVVVMAHQGSFIARSTNMGVPPAAHA